MSESITFDLPLPPRECSPKARAHYHRKARAVKWYRCAAALAVSMKCHKRWLLSAATIQFEFTFQMNRRRDEDKLLASMKAAIDGFADAGIVHNESAFTVLPILIAAPNKNKQFVRVTITNDENNTKTEPQHATP